MLSIFKTAFFLTAFFLISGCNDFAGKERSTHSRMYDFDHPKIIHLAEELDGISGIVYYPKDTSVFAIVDDAGILFKIPLKHPNNTRQWQFDKKRDFEDLVLVDSSFYVLISNGDIEKIHFHGDSIRTSLSDFSAFSGAADEFEALYLNLDSNELVLLCKTCETDPKNMISRFSYRFRDSIPFYRPYLSVNMAPVAEKLDINKHLRPSASAINPVTGDLYILSSIQKMIVVFDAGGAFKELFKLDPGLYKQAEGIAFTPDGDLIISNESAEEGHANLLLFKNKMKPL